MSSFEKFLDKYLNTLVVLGGVSALMCLILYFGVYRYDSSLTTKENVLNKKNREKILPVLVVLSILECILLLLYYKKSRENLYDFSESYSPENVPNNSEIEKWRTYNIIEEDDRYSPCNHDDWLEILYYDVDSDSSYDSNERIMNS